MCHNRTFSGRKISPSVASNPRDKATAALAAQRIFAQTRGGAHDEISSPFAAILIHTAFELSRWTAASATNQSDQASWTLASDDAQVLTVATKGT